jgi:hypothetical protein
MMRYEEGMNHESSDQGSTHVILGAKLKQTVAFNLWQEGEQVCHGYNVGIVVCQGSHQRLDVL